MSVEFKKNKNITFSRRGSCGPDQLLLYILITNEGAAAEEEKRKRTMATIKFAALVGLGFPSRAARQTQNRH